MPVLLAACRSGPPSRHGFRSLRPVQQRDAVGDEHPDSLASGAVSTPKRPEESTFMVVERVSTGSGSVIEPAYDASWDELTGLRWQAAVTCVDAGFPPGHVRVFPGGLLREERRWGRTRMVPVPGVYSISIGSLSAAAYRAHEVRDVLHGVALGADEVRRLERDDRRRVEADAVDGDRDATRGGDEGCGTR